MSWLTNHGPYPGGGDCAEALRGGHDGDAGSVDWARVYLVYWLLESLRMSGPREARATKNEPSGSRGSCPNLPSTGVVEEPGDGNRRASDIPGDEFQVMGLLLDLGCRLGVRGAQ